MYKRLENSSSALLCTTKNLLTFPNVSPRCKNSFGVFVHVGFQIVDFDRYLTERILFLLGDSLVGISTNFAMVREFVEIT